MKTFISYRHTGEDQKSLEKLLIPIRDTMQEEGVEAYCTFFDEDEFQGKSFGPREIMNHAFSIIDKSDFLFVVQTSDSKSEGMLMEVGYCIANNIPVVVATKDTVGYTYMPDMATVSFRWKDPEDLAQKIAKTNFSNLKSS
ncbi:MAG: hypothetical protein QG675_324 [Patescibacteria group bacterium]|jgi:nucleoside 2-deoxyribosyltransferase|nr:hypothetical protein [Patescibacteria group bacterium]